MSTELDFEPCPDQVGRHYDLVQGHDGLVGNLQYIMEVCPPPKNLEADIGTLLVAMTIGKGSFDLQDLLASGHCPSSEAWAILGLRIHAPKDDTWGLKNIRKGRHHKDEITDVERKLLFIYETARKDLK